MDYLQRSATEDLPRYLRTGAEIQTHLPLQRLRQFFKDHFATSNAFRASSERLRADTYALVQERDQLTAKNQAHSSKNIGDRANDIDFWKSELRHETDLLISETNALAEVSLLL